MSRTVPNETYVKGGQALTTGAETRKLKISPLLFPLTEG